MNRAAFFDAVRANPFKGGLSQQQVTGMAAILDEWEARKFTDLRWLAYMLATTFHETARTMQPIHEYGGPQYFKRYDGRRDLGNTMPGDGNRFHGRGYVQCTGRANYARASEELGVDFVAHPDRVLEPRFAAAIMFLGMSHGWFTTKRLSNYFTDTKADWKNARRIINALDKADTIAGYGKAFYGALLRADDAMPEPVRPPPDIPAPERLPSPVDDFDEADPVRIPKEPEMAQKTGTGSIIGLIVIVGLVGLFIYAKFFAGWI